MQIQVQLFTQYPVVEVGSNLVIINAILTCSRCTFLRMHVGIKVRASVTNCQLDLENTVLIP